MMLREQRRPAEFASEEADTVAGRIRCMRRAEEHANEVAEYFRHATGVADRPVERARAIELAAEWERWCARLGVALRLLEEKEKARRVNAEPLNEGSRGKNVS